MMGKIFRLSVILLLFLSSTLSAQDKHIEYVVGGNVNHFFNFSNDIYQKIAYKPGLGFNAGISYKAWHPRDGSFTISLQFLQQSGGLESSFGHRYWSSQSEARFSTSYLLLGLYPFHGSCFKRRGEFSLGFEGLLRIGERTRGSHSSFDLYTGTSNQGEISRPQGKKIVLNLFTSFAYPIPTQNKVQFVPKFIARLGFVNRLNESVNSYNLMYGLEMGVRYQLKKTKE